MFICSNLIYPPYPMVSLVRLPTILCSIQSSPPHSLNKNPAASFSWKILDPTVELEWSFISFTGFWLNGDVCPSTMAQNTRKLFLTVKKLHIVDIDICWSGGTPHPISHSFFVPIPANGGMFLGMISWLIFMLKGGKSLKVIGIWELAFDNVHLVYI